MKILVLGGSYFLGKHFVELAGENNEITVFNRGTKPLNISGITQIHGDRHDIDALKKLSEQNFDAVVDFCAYQAGDIRMVIENLGKTCRQYIYVSTVDVYERGLQRVLDEDAPFETRDFGGQAGQYILGKAALEKELEECAKAHGMARTSIRPAFIYGPYNYAPREGMYFHWIKNAGQVLHPSDATAEFQLVYVKDVARAIIKALLNADAYDKAYNLSGQAETYDSFVEVLKRAVDLPFEKVEVPVASIFEKGIALPFPLTREESNWYDGSRALSLIGEYTPLEAGLKETARAYFGENDEH